MIGVEASRALLRQVHASALASLAPLGTERAADLARLVGLVVERDR